MKHRTSRHNLIYGAHAVLEALRNPKRTCQALWVSKGIDPEVEEAIKEHPQLELNYVDNHELDRMVV